MSIQTQAAKVHTSLVRNTFLNAQLKKKRDLVEGICSGLSFREKPLSQKTPVISVLIFMAVHDVSCVLAILQEKINHVEEQLLWGKSVLNFEGKLYFTIRFIIANCSLLHFYPLLKGHEIPSSQRGWRIKTVLVRRDLITCCRFDVWKCFCGNKHHWKILNDIQKDRTVFAHWNSESSL